jgi:hypothetical protein
MASYAKVLMALKIIREHEDDVFQGQNLHDHVQ